MIGKQISRHQEKNVGYIFRRNFRQNFRQIFRQISVKISAKFPLDMLSDQRLDMCQAKVCLQHGSRLAVVG